MTPTNAKRVGRGLGGGLVAAGALAVVVGLFSPEATAGDRVNAVALLPLLTAAALMLWHQPSLPITWALGTHAYAWTLGVLDPVIAPMRVGDWPGAVVADRAVHMTWPLLFPLLPVILLLFPEPPLARRGRVVLGVALASIAVTVLTFAVEADDGEPAWLFHLDQVALVTLLACGVAAVVRLVLLRRRARGQRRAQISLVLGAGAAVVGLYVLGGLAALVFGTGDQSGVFGVIAGLLVVGAVPAAIATALLRHQLYGVDLVVNRALVWGGLIVLTAGVATLATEGVAATLDRPAPDPLLIVLPCILVAVVAVPLRSVLQRGADALLPSLDPDREAFRSLARRLEGAIPVDHVPALIAEGVGEGLALSGVQVVENTADGEVVVATWGDPDPADPQGTVPLRHGGDSIGTLQVWPEPNARQRDLLTDVAAHAATALHASSLTRDLQRSRERLVWGREEERRRLRQDLHDELSPSLAGIRLAVAAARTRGVPAETDPLLARAQSGAADAVDVIRQILDDLRPPALDDLGLAGALTKRAESLSRAGEFEVTIVDEDLPSELTPAVEVGLFRIASEAMANAARHAGGTRCTVTLSREDGAVRVVVKDDGEGLGPERGQGVGLKSMRERAESLSGTLETVNGQGLAVIAVIPHAVPGGGAER